MIAVVVRARPTLIAKALAACFAVVALACASPRRDGREFEASQDRFARLPGRLREALVAARAELDAGRAAEAASRLESELDEHASFAVHAMHQDAVLAVGGQAAYELVERARFRALQVPTCAHLLLWARVCPDSAESRAAIEHALSLDPRDPWAHYAQGHARAAEGDWVAAADSVQRALALDPGHRAARRLEAAVLARGGKVQEAIDALDAWLDATRADPRVPREWRTSAELDLAHLHLLDGRPARALERLRNVDAPQSVELTRLTLLAAAEQAVGRPGDALATTERAREVDPRALTPMVQAAILRQHDLGDPEGARAAWTAVLEATRGAADLASLIQGLRARIVLERERPSSPAP